MADQFWRHGRLADGPHEGVCRREQAPKKMYAEERLKAEIVAEALAKSGNAISTPRDRELGR